MAESIGNTDTYGPVLAQLLFDFCYRHAMGTS